MSSGCMTGTPISRPGPVATDVADADVSDELLEPMRLLISMHPGETPRSQFAGTSWTARVGAVLFLVFVAATVAVLGSYFGPIGWAVAFVIVVAAGVAILRDRSAT